MKSTGYDFVGIFYLATTQETNCTVGNNAMPLHTHMCISIMYQISWSESLFLKRLI